MPEQDQPKKFFTAAEWGIKKDDFEFSKPSIVDLLKAEMKDEMAHQEGLLLMGPALYGFDETGAPNFIVLRGNTNSWWIINREDFEFIPKEAQPNGLVR